VFENRDGSSFTEFWEPVNFQDTIPYALFVGASAFRTPDGVLDTVIVPRLTDDPTPYHPTTRTKEVIRGKRRHRTIV
jgi:hypothetical protein